MAAAALIILVLLSAPGLPPEGEDQGPVAAGPLTLLSPNGGEYWIAGEVHPVDWTGGAPGLAFALLYSNFSNLGPWKPVAGNVSSPYDWSVPNDRTNSAWVRVEARNSSGALVENDTSDNPFAIERAPEKRAWIVWPNGGERFANGSSVFVRWDSEFGAGARGSLRVTCGGIASNYTFVAADLPPRGQHLWAANLTGGGCFLRLRMNDTLVSHTDHSDRAFQVYELPLVEILSPAAGAAFAAGGSLALVWNTSGGASRLLVNVSASWRGEPHVTLAAGLEDPKRLEIDLPETATSNGSLRVEAWDELGNNASDEARNLTLEVRTPSLGTIRGNLSTPEGPLLNGHLYLYLYSNSSPPAVVQAGTSGADGNFTFLQLTPGLYLIEAEAPGYERTGTVVAVAANRTTWADITLRPVPPPGIEPATAWSLALAIALLGIAAAIGIVLYWRWLWTKHPDLAKRAKTPDPRTWRRRWLR